ncbi:MAG: HBL/NHE enterotoxin family protein [Verrucomicrobiales bacterium]
MSADNIIHLTFSSEAQLSPKELYGDVITAANAAALMQVHSLVIATQGSLSLVEPDSPEAAIFEKLSYHQALSTKHAQRFLDSLEPRLIGVLSDLSASATQFATFFKHARPLLAELSQGTGEKAEAARAELTSLLEALEEHAGSLQSKIKKLNADFAILSAQIVSVQSALQADLETVREKVSGEDGELQKIKEQIDAAQAGNRLQITKIVLGSAGFAAGAVIIAIGAVGALPSGGTTVGAIISGVGIIITGGATVVEAAVELDNNNRELATLYERSAEINASYAHLSVAGDQLESLTEAAADQGNALSALEIGWGEISRDIGAIKARLIHGQVDPVHLDVTLRLAGQAWAEMADQAEDVEKQLVNVPIQTVDEIPAPQKIS